MLRRYLAAVLACWAILAVSALVAIGQERAPGKDVWQVEDLLELLGPSKALVKPFLPIGYEEETTIGSATALEVFRRYGAPYEDPALNRYVNLLGPAVARYSDRPDIPYHFAILDTDEVNAFAAPGGYIFITLGLLRHVRNEAELAGILGHEITHVSQKHMLKDLEEKRRYKGAGQITMALLDQDPRFFEELVDTVSDTLFYSGLAWDDEFDSDRLGTEFARRTGYDPGGLRNFLLTLRGIEGRKESIFFRTHPSPDKRLERLDYFIAERYQEDRNLAQVADRYQYTVLRRVGTAAVPDLRDETVEKKLTPEQRAALSERAQTFASHLYRSVLGREPDAEGLRSFTEALASGRMSPNEIIRQFFNSPEYLQRGHDEEAFLTTAYRAVLQRDPDPGGKSTFLARLKSGEMSREEVLAALLNSQEYLANRLW